MAFFRFRDIFSFEQLNVNGNEDMRAESCLRFFIGEAAMHLL
jgi:hypothetical protein